MEFVFPACLSTRVQDVLRKMYDMYDDVWGSTKNNRQKKKEYLTMLHAMHRTMYMGERLSYAERRLKAEQGPANYSSTIADGTAQNHCLLPYFANMYTVSLTLCYFLLYFPY